MRFGVQRGALHDDRDGFRNHSLVEELRRNSRAFVTSRLSEKVDKVGHIAPSVGFQEGPSYVLDVSKPVLKIRSVVIRGKGDRGALCRRSFQNMRLVFFVFSSKVHRNRPDAERNSLPLRHSFDLVIEPDAEVLGASVSQNPVLRESHVEGVDREKVSAEIRPVFAFTEFVLEGSQGAVWSVSVYFRGRRDFPFSKRRAVKVFFQAFHPPTPSCSLPSSGFLLPYRVALASVPGSGSFSPFIIDQSFLWLTIMSRRILYASR